jgi:hypothetical protein
MNLTLFNILGLFGAPPLRDIANLRQMAAGEMG